MWMLMLSILMTLLLMGLLLWRVMVQSCSDHPLEGSHPFASNSGTWDWQGLIADRDRALQLEFERETRFAHTHFEHGFAAHPQCFRAEGRIWSE
jgi:hypothetical protein